MDSDERFWLYSSQVCMNMFINNIKVIISLGLSGVLLSQSLFHVNKSEINPYHQDALV